jgi:uncharacterized protein YhfF
MLATVLVSGAAAAAGDVDSASNLWARCAGRLGVAVDQPVRTRRFGETKAMTQLLLPLILAGEKTITTTSPWLYGSDPSAKPAEGAYSIVLDETGVPRAVLRTIAVKTVPFDAVTEEDSRYEGPTVRRIEAWREVHVRYFTRVLARVGKVPTPDMPVTLERFEVVCRADDPAD